MPTIQLNNAQWTYDEDARLGPPGGFGEVFRGLGTDGAVAVKRLKLTASAAAHREMNIGQVLAGRTLQHVVPVIDFGQDANSDAYFLVMPICERSLHDELTANGPLTLGEAQSVALDILAGLREVGDIVHRDLKPGNVLFFEGNWRLADFGIAKFVEDSTSLQTLRGSLTPAYGAPEQWRGEAPTRATDVYALGCIVHAMLNGKPPFEGSQDEIREAHLHQTPPPLGGDPRLSALVSQMLRKSPEARPIIARCIDIMSAVGTSQNKPKHAGLLSAATKVGRELAEADAAAKEAATRRQQRQQLAQDAIAELNEIIARLFGEIAATSDDARVHKDNASLGRGTLTLGAVQIVTGPDFANSSGYSEWEVAAHAILTITRFAKERPSQTPQGHQVVYVMRHTAEDRDYRWSASLFFGRSSKDPTFRWREAAFWSYREERDGQDAPFGLSAEDREFKLAFSNVMGVTNVAYGPLSIDGEDEDAFQHRWLTLFSKAALGNLSRPNQMPVPDHYFR